MLCSNLHCTYPIACRSAAVGAGAAFVNASLASTAAAYLIAALQRRRDLKLAQQQTGVAAAAAALTAPADRTALPRSRTPLFMGNWKLNPATSSAAVALAAVIAQDATDAAAEDKSGLARQIVVVPPSVFLYDVQKACAGSPVALGAQVYNVMHTHVH
jgi:Triosephosphate isomerase